VLFIFEGANIISLFDKNDSNILTGYWC